MGIGVLHWCWIRAGGERAVHSASTCRLCVGGGGCDVQRRSSALKPLFLCFSWEAHALPCRATSTNTTERSWTTVLCFDGVWPPKLHASNAAKCLAGNVFVPCHIVSSPDINCSGVAEVQNLLNACWSPQAGLCEFPLCFFSSTLSFVYTRLSTLFYPNTHHRRLHSFPVSLATPRASLFFFLQKHLIRLRPDLNSVCALSLPHSCTTFPLFFLHHRPSSLPQPCRR